MFFDDAPAAFANLSRWLVPGGRFAFAAWGPTADNPWMTSVRDAAAEAVEIPPPDPEAPGAFRYAEADRLLTLLSGARFGELEVHDWRGALPLGGGLPAAEAATFALATFASFGELLAKAGDDALDRARQSLTARFPDINRTASSGWTRACTSSPARARWAWSASDPASRQRDAGDLTAVVEQTVLQLRNLAPPGSPPWVAGDRGRCRSPARPDRR